MKVSAQSVVNRQSLYTYRAGGNVSHGGWGGGWVGGGGGVVVLVLVCCPFHCPQSLSANLG